MNATPSDRRSLPLWLWVLLSALLSALAACSNNPPPNPTISVQPTDTAASVGSAATLSVGASGLDLSYQWQQSTDGGSTWADIAGATQASHTTPPASLADNGKRFRVVVAAAGISVTSSAVVLTVTAAVVAPSISIQPVAQTITAGQDASYSVTAAGTALAYQWQRSTDTGTTFNAVVGATQATLNLTAVPLADNGQRLRVVVSNSAGGVTSSAALLTVNAPAGDGAPAFSTHPADIAVTAGQDAQFVVVVSGTPTPTLQWQMRNNPNVIWGNLTIDGIAQTGTTLDVVGTTLAQNGFQFRVLATNGGGVATSTVATLTVNAATVAPSFTTQPLSVTITEGQNAQFTAAVSGTPTPALQWQFSTDGSNWSNINGATATVFNVIGAALANNGRQFRAVASNSAGSTNSNAATLTVNAAPPAGKAWQTAVLIETNNANDGTRAQVATDAGGNAVAVWQQVDPANAAMSIWANRYTPAAGWGTAVLIETFSASDAFAPQIAIDGSGNAIAVWQQADLTATVLSIWANRYDAATNTWGAAAVIGAGMQPQIAIDGSGNALAVWNLYNGTGSVWANRYTAGTGWGTAARIETGATNSAGPPQIAINASGNAIAVWNRFDGARNNIWANRYTATANTWGTAALIETGNAGTAEAPEIAIDASGNGVAVWRYHDGTRYTTMVNHYTASTDTWGSVALNLNPTGDSSDPQVAFDAAGNAIAVWPQWDGAGTRYSIWASRYTAGVGWDAPAPIETDNAGDAAGAQIAFDPSGNAFAVWYQFDGTRHNIWSNRYTAGTGWGTAALRETLNAGDALRPQIAIDASGNAIAVWDQHDGSRISIWASSYR